MAPLPWVGRAVRTRDRPDAPRIAPFRGGADIASVTCRRALLRFPGRRSLRASQPRLHVIPERLRQQLAFAVELDRLKSVLRQTRVTDGSRRENSAEHSWHVALMAPLLAEHAGAEVDVIRVMKMLLVHDVVEIDAGDTFCYDAASNADKGARERAAADRLFGLLPEDQGRELRALWEEFDGMESDDARFANALDRLQPLLLNREAEGGTWTLHDITEGQVRRRMAPVRDGAPPLWPLVEEVLAEAVGRRWIRPGEPA